MIIQARLHLLSLHAGGAGRGSAVCLEMQLAQVPRPTASLEDNLESGERWGDLKPSAAPMGPHTALWLTASIRANIVREDSQYNGKLLLWVSQDLDLEVL